MFYPTVSSLKKARIRLACAVALGAFLAGQACPAAYAKRTALQTPAYDKLTVGAGPQTNDVEAKAPATAALPKLAPVKLGDALDSDASSGDGSAGYLKSTVTATGFAPKGPIDPSSQSLFAPRDNLSGKLGSGSILKQARAVNVVPLPLMESTEEVKRKVDTMLDAEKVQLADLWEATLTRSPDIQFVVQKLMPTSRPGHASTVMMRMLSSAIFGAMGAVNMMSPNPGMYAGTTTATSVFMNLLQMQEGKSAQKARITQTETIMLYNMVRNTADRLVEAYRSYKKNMAALAKASDDLKDLQNMVAEARAGQDAAKQVEMEYTIRRAQRDIDGVTEDLRRYRQGLVDLAGSEAVAKLDRQLEEEEAQIEQATPVGQPGNPQTAVGPGTQS